MTWAFPANDTTSSFDVLKRRVEPAAPSMRQNIRVYDYHTNSVYNWLFEGITSIALWVSMALTLIVIVLAVKENQ